MVTFKRNMAVAEDLQLLSKAQNYSQWLYSLVHPYLGRKILEIGSGVGTYSTMLVNYERVWLSDYDPDYLSNLQEKFAVYKNVTSHHLDLSNLNERLLLELSREGLDTVLLMNVLEHVENDADAIAVFDRYLGAHGRVVLLVPAISTLYGALDISYGHYRRYNVTDISRLTKSTHFHTRVVRYYNIFAIPAWFWASKIMQVNRLSPRSVKTFDKAFVPIVSKLEAVFQPPIGASMLIVLEK